MKHVLITGGAGLVGSHLTDLFLARGYAVTVVDNFVTGTRANLNEASKNPNFHLVESDVCEPFPTGERGIDRLISKHGLAGVLHFACPASPVDFDRIPFEILAVDSVGTFRTVELALAHDARYILASTSEIYGDPFEHPQKETYWGNVNTIGPRACYDETKRFAEAVVSTATRGVGKFDKKAYKPLNGGIVRIFNTYGPRMRIDDGRIVPELCRQALQGESLTLHGDGQQTRSFCYVSDLCDGIFKLFESRVTEPVNIGNPIEKTALEFAEVALKLTGSKSRIAFLPARPDDPRKRCPDTTRAKTLLNWSAQVSLEEGLQRTIDFFRETLKA